MGAGVISEASYADALDAIVGAALEPSRWMDVLRRLAAMTGCVAGGLTIEDAQTRQGEPLVYFGFDEDHVRKTFDHYLPMNPLFGIAPRMNTGLIVANGDVVETREFVKSEFYNGWAKPQQLCCPVTVVLQREGSSYCPLTLVRPDGTGNVSGSEMRLLQRLAPHLIRAMKTTIALERKAVEAHCSEVALDACDVAIAVLDADGTIVHANGGIERILAAREDVRSVKGVLTLRSLEADGRLQTAVREASRQEGVGSDLKIDRDGKPPLLLTVLPVRNGVPLADFGGRAARCVVIVQDTVREREARLSFVSAAYNVTPAERRLLSAIVTGAGVATAAQALDISLSTAKTHLCRLFDKTGTGRQGELINLVLSSPASRAPYRD